MKLIIKTAIKNILGAGVRTWLNVGVLSFVFVVIVLYNGVSDGWIDDARRDTIQWQTGKGEIWHPKYDRFDIFSLQNAHGHVPRELQKEIDNGQTTPILITQGVIYPQGRLQNVILNGIPVAQNVLKIPSNTLISTDSTTVVAAIGERMSKASGLKKGDRVMMRWRNTNGTFDACEVLITTVFYTPVPAVDNMQIWINLSDLQRLLIMPDEATLLVRSSEDVPTTDLNGWMYKDLKFLLSDIDAMRTATLIESSIIFLILLSIALLAIFDTQVLAIFRRQREIGTYVALGFTPRAVTYLFTLEGIMYSVMGVILGAVWGLPIFILFNVKGLDISSYSGSFESVGGMVMYPAFKITSILTTVFIIVLSSAIISFMPCRKIAKQSIANALKGKFS